MGIYIKLNGEEENKMTNRCAYYPGMKKLVVINNSGETQTTSVKTSEGVHSFTINAYDQVTMDL